VPEHVNLNTHWFYIVWPFIGVGAAIVMIAVLLWTDAFRANFAVSRWRDLVWLCWLAVPLFANGIVHTLGGVTEGAYNTGLWTAAFLFIPLSIWVLYAVTIRGPYSGKVVGVSFACGAVTHADLFGGYGLYKAAVIGNTGLVYAGVIGCTPLILALARPFFQPESLRPIVTPPASAEQLAAVHLATAG
jgi:uncharacterized protein with HXXEE motif